MSIKDGDLIDDWVKSHEQWMYQLRLKGTKYNLDNRTFYMDLKKLMQRELAYWWISSFEGSVERNSTELALGADFDVMDQWFSIF